MEDVDEAAVVVDEDEDDDDTFVEQWHVENPLKKHTEHCMAMAPSDLRSNVADCWRIMT